MNKIRTFAVFTAGLFALGAVTPAFAAKKDKKKAEAEAAAAMAQMQQRTTPNENHAALEPIVGEWMFTSSWWMTADAKPEVSPGSAEISWVHGRRFLKQDVKGTAMGQAFEGTGYLGYDVIRNEYQSIWMDNMNTALMMQTGLYDSAVKTLKLSGNASCPMTGEKDRWGRSEWKIVSPDQHVYTMYSKDATGKEFKTGEIVYQRVK